MARVFAIIAFVAMLVQSSGLSLAAVGGGCEGCCAGAKAAADSQSNGCEADGDAGDCSPGCDRCLCCAHHRVVTLSCVAATRPAVSQQLARAAASDPALSSDPGEILHVPKRSDSVS